MRKKLKLKQCSLENESTQRIYDITQDTCERFNSYYMDFVESVAILTEKYEAGSADQKETKEQIDYMNGKIDELLEFMRTVSDQMPDFIEMADSD
ncbi:MAG: hypothetical protein PF637_14460 [Spirochaetes bacterium]|jgi:TolA-binding protein|nr:hypothetical protein [Spirochaetota bacterium]